MRKTIIYTMNILLIALCLGNAPLFAAAAGVEVEEGPLCFRQVAYMRYENGDGSKRERAKDATKQFIAQRTQNQSITFSEDTPPTKSFLFYHLRKTKNDKACLIEDKEAHLLISYHFRKDGKHPSYKPGVLSDRWAYEITHLDPATQVVVCAVSVLGENNILSLHLVDRNDRRLLQRLKFLQPIFSPPSPSPSRRSQMDMEDVLALFEQLRVSLPESQTERDALEEACEEILMKLRSTKKD